MEKLVRLETDIRTDGQTDSSSLFKGRKTEQIT